jgi:acyl-CoA synthetase (AMP-forming)/AMP-acid ligase II
VSRLAGALRGRGVASDDRVAVMALNSDRYYQLLHAAAWADAITVPVNIRWSVAEIAHSLNEAGVRPTGNKFSGQIDWVQIDIGDDSHDHLIKPEDRLIVAMARQ